MRIVAAVQARMGSSRLKNKVVADIEGMPMIIRVMERLKLCRGLDNVILMVPEGLANEPLRVLANTFLVPDATGPELDILERMISAGKYADGIVRICADCPLIDPEIVDRAVKVFRTSNWDYVCNILPRTFPDGLDVEIYSLEMLYACRQQLPPGHTAREWIALWVWQNRDRFRAYSFCYPLPLAHYRWTVDYEEDLAFVRHIYQELGSGFTMQDVLNLLDREPHWIRTSADHGTYGFKEMNNA